jgi:serine protease Do
MKRSHPVWRPRLRDWSSHWACLLVWSMAALLGPALVVAQTPPAPPVPAPPPAAPAARLFSLRGGYLGIGIQEISSERAKALKLREEAGVEITSVMRESPAEKAGLKSGDVVISYNGQKVEGMEQFSRMVRETPAGREVKVDIVRNGTPQTVTVKIDSRTLPRIFTGDGVHFNMPNIPMPDIPRVFPGLHSPMLGIEAESLEGQLAQYFGVRDGGVLVRSVLKDSAAEKAGLKAGDVILRLDDIKVTSAADISARLRAAPGKAVQLTVMRERKEMTIPVTPETGERAERNPR